MLLVQSILLTEGRVENVRERYPEIGDDTFGFFVNNDPSSNQKYLDWMVGEYMDGTSSAITTSPFYCAHVEYHP